MVDSSVLSKVAMDAFDEEQWAGWGHQVGLLAVPDIGSLHGQIQMALSAELPLATSFLGYTALRSVHSLRVSGTAALCPSSQGDSFSHLLVALF